jgi:hypothetical protein
MRRFRPFGWPRVNESNRPPKQSLAAADHSAFSAMEQHKPELNRKSRVDRCLQLCFISNSKLSWGGDIGNDDQNRAFEQAGFGVL